VRPSLAIRSIAAGILTAGSTWGAPVTFNTALPVGGGEFVARGMVVVNQSGEDPGTADRDRNATSLVTVLGYGVTHKLALFGVLPYVDKELDHTVSGSRVKRMSAGVGDVTVFARYTLVQRDQPGRTFRVAPFAGVKAPTGDDDDRDSLGRLPASVQPGSGAWDVFGGVVATFQTFAFQADGQMSYRVKGEANGVDPGDELRLDGSLQYRLWPRQLGNGVPSFLYGVLESNLVHRDRNEVNGSDDANSGGTTLFLSPGLQYVTKRWIVEGVVQLPVVQNLHGTALENDYVLRAGFRFNF
jgi:hypothetical protein